MSKLYGFRLTAGMFLASFLFLLLVLDLRVGLFDESILLTGGMNVAAGAVPHRDFYINYGPAQLYVIAGLFKIFGSSFLAARVWDVMVRALIVALTWHLLAGRVRTVAALVAAAASGMWMFGLQAYLYPVFPNLLFALVGTVLLLPPGKAEPTRGRLVAAGMCTGIVVLFRYDVGFLVLAGHSAALAILAFESGLPVRLVALRAFGRIMAYGIGTALTFLPPALLMLAAGAFPGFFHDIFEYPLKYYAEMRGLPFPGLVKILAWPPEAADYLPFAAAAIGAFALFGRAGKSDTLATADGKAFIVTLAALTLALSFKGLIRFQLVHLVLAIVPATILLAFLVERSRGPARALAAATALLAIAASAYQAASAVNDFLRAPGLTFGGQLAGGPLGQVYAPADGMPWVMLDINTACTVQYLRERTSPHEPIFSATGRHDKILVNNIALYFLTGRKSASRWYQFDPGLQTRADAQSAMVEELIRSNVSSIVRDSTWDEREEENGSALSSGVTVLDDYLDGHFVPEARFGTVTILRRKGLATVPPAPFRCSAGS